MNTAYRRHGFYTSGRTRLFHGDDEESMLSAIEEYEQMLATRNLPESVRTMLSECAYDLREEMALRRMEADQ